MQMNAVKQARGGQMQGKNFCFECLITDRRALHNQPVWFHELISKYAIFYPLWERLTREKNK
jgi:23S rRNA A1618 N6-methylase RlmF